MIPILDHSLTKPLYLQIYTYIKDAILIGSIKPGEKLPSLRGLSKDLGLSLTTVGLSYNQLLVEGYISSRPQSGYFANAISAGVIASPFEGRDQSLSQLNDVTPRGFYSDLSSFDFVKWKKCMNKILNDYPHLLLEEGSPQGEETLRSQISRYIYQSRGVRCHANQIVIGAGTQQITNLLAIMLSMIGIEDACFEDPGYRPARSTFISRGFGILPIPVGREGILIEELPLGIRSSVYVSPSNQFPLGSVMPIARRYALLEWAKTNNSIIIEDDYDSELRYFGRPIPSLSGLDNGEHVVYLGSFSSTLFPSIKISYMVLPEVLLALFKTMVNDYTQTCSKAEQLTLALYMQNGLYQTNIKKLRKLYTQKAKVATDSINKRMPGVAKILNNSSGVHMLLEVTSKQSPEELCLAAATLGIEIIPITKYTFQKIVKDNAVLIFYYTRIPLQEIDGAIKRLSNIWQK